MANNLSYTAGSFELQIDGHPTNAYIKSMDGGFGKMDHTVESVGSKDDQIKHGSKIDFDPLSFDIGMSGSESILLWIQESWRRKYSRRNGMVTHADFDLKSQLEHEFYEALIQEVGFPALDGGSKDAAYLNVKIMPERSVIKSGSGERIQGTSGPKQKLWLANSFRLTIDGLDDMQYTNKVEAFTIKQSIKVFKHGGDRYPTIEPYGIEFPNIKGTIALERATGLLDWYKKYIIDGQADPKSQKSGTLEFLKPDRKDVIFRVNLFEVGLAKVAIPKHAANANEIKRASFELSVGRMDIDGAGKLGLE